MTLLAIYMSVRRNSFQSDKSNAKDATIARRLTTIVLTDFLCWFPVSCLGISEGNDQTAERGTVTGLGYSSLDRDHPASMEDCYA
nr:hypothetical protein BaRGS_033596 [Batillaria attramentaria]